VEDHDRVRSRPEFTAALVEDLDWLGFVPDDGCVPLVRQSDRSDLYRRALEDLRTAAHVYACDCSRTDIRGERYGGRCRDRALAETPGRGLRVQIDSSPVHATDVLAGRLEQVPSDQCGDILVKDRDGNWSYQFGVTVDDLSQGVTLIIRGTDLESSTGRQVLLARMLGRAASPLFLHHPLILDPSGKKLSKSAGDTGVRELRAQGFTAADVIGMAAFAVRLTARPRPIAAANVTALFALGSPSLG